jgi:GcrA cell cycle regulator
MQSSWADEHSRALREYLEKGLSFSRIAKAINARFNTAYSRNATIGRARRMGLSAPERLNISAARKPRRKPRPAQLLKMRARALVPSRPKRAVLKRAAALKLRCVGIVPRHLSLLELEPGDCRYPYGGEAEGGGHHLLRPPAPRGFELLRRAFSPDQHPRHRIGALGRQGGVAAGGGGMSTKVTVIAVRIKRLSPRHRLAHLRALIRREPAGSNRWLTLVALLRDQSATTPANDNRSR